MSRFKELLSAKRNGHGRSWSQVSTDDLRQLYVMEKIDVIMLAVLFDAKEADIQKTIKRSKLDLERENVEKLELALNSSEFNIIRESRKGEIFNLEEAVRRFSIGRIVIWLQAYHLNQGSRTETQAIVNAILGKKLCEPFEQSLFGWFLELDLNEENRRAVQFVRDYIKDTQKVCTAWVFIDGSLYR